MTKTKELKYEVESLDRTLVYIRSGLSIVRKVLMEIVKDTKNENLIGLIKEI